MYTGNLIGKRRLVYQGNAGGIWNTPHHHNAISEKIWPTTGIKVITTVQASATSITQPATQAGDLLVIYNRTTNTGSTTPPTLVTPSGYTNALNITRNVTQGTRSTLFYKIADGTEGGVSVNGMSSTQNQMYLTLFRWQQKSISSVSVQNTASASSGDTVTISHTKTISGGSYPLILFVISRTFFVVPYSFSSSETYELPSFSMFDATNTNLTLSTYDYNDPNSNPNISLGVTNGNLATIHLGYKIFNYPGPYTNIVYQQQGDANYNLVGSCYLQIS